MKSALIQVVVGEESEMSILFNSNLGIPTVKTILVMIWPLYVMPHFFLLVGIYMFSEEECQYGCNHV